MDVLALLSYGAIMRSPVTVTRTPLVSPEQPGVLATLATYQRVSPVEIRPEDLLSHSGNVVEGSPTAIALRHLRDALTARTATGAQWNYWAAIEAIALDESTDWVEHKCQQCGAIHHGDRATMPLIRKFFEQFDSFSSEAAKQRATRSQTVHGSGLRNVATQKELGSRVMAIEPVALRLLSERSGLFPATSAGLVISTPIAIYDLMRRADGVTEVRPKKWEAKMASPRLPVGTTLGRDQTIEVGIPTQPGEDVAEIGSWDSEWAEIARKTDDAGI